MSLFLVMLLTLRDEPLSRFSLESKGPRSAGGGGVDILGGVTAIGVFESAADLFDDEDDAVAFTLA